jgi:hypothetical protein
VGAIHEEIKILTQEMEKDKSVIIKGITALVDKMI